MSPKEVQFVHFLCGAGSAGGERRMEDKDAGLNTMDQIEPEGERH